MAENMDIRELTPNQVRAVYKQHIMQDFPADERKPLTAILHALTRREYVCYGAFRQDTLLAYAFFVALKQDEKNAYLFDYLAVCRGMRGQGIGSAFLQGLMAGPLQSAGCVLLEIDDPDQADTPEEHALRLRRERFYMRNGLRHTGVSALVYHVYYRILELPVSPAHTPQAVAALYQRLYHAIMPEWVSKRMVKILPMENWQGETIGASAAPKTPHQGTEYPGPAPGESAE